MKRLTLALATMLVLATVTVAVAQQPAPAATETTAAAPAALTVDKGDTAWILTSAALVLMMTAPGLALFYGGMVRQKNALGTLMQCFIVMAVISVQWVLWGYSLAFGPDRGGIIGRLDWVGLNGVGPEPYAAYSETVPHQAFMLFQDTEKSSAVSGVALAGGFNQFANRARLVVLRSDADKQVRIPFNYNRVVAGEEENVYLRPNDIILVP